MLKHLTMDRRRKQHSTAKISALSLWPKYGCKVRSIVTDNEKKMGKMKRMLQEDDDQLIVYGCSSHWLNLLGQQVTPSQIMKHIVEVQKYFRNHHHLVHGSKKFQIQSSHSFQVTQDGTVNSAVSKLS